LTKIVLDRVDTIIALHVDLSKSVLYEQVSCQYLQNFNLP